MKLAVAITVNDRPEYLMRVIQSWANVRGIENTWVIFQVEPTSEVCFDLCKDAGFNKKLVLLNQVQMGALGNPYVAMQSGFSSVGDIDFVIVGEDDSVVTPDALEFFSFAARHYSDHPLCLGACSFQAEPTGAADIVFPRHYFASVVWGTWRDRWDVIREHWPFDYQPAWDRYLLDLVKDTEHYFAFPGISRSQHIGKYGGTHMPPDQFELLQAKRVHSGSRQNYKAIGGIKR
jgi:hypothetical protein